MTQQSSSTLVETKQSNLFTTKTATELTVRDGNGAIVSQQSTSAQTDLSQHSKAGLWTAGAAAGELAVGTIASALSGEAITLDHGVAALTCAATAGLTAFGGS